MVAMMLANQGTLRQATDSMLRGVATPPGITLFCMKARAIFNYYYHQLMKT
jgi:hypothetical protein